MARGERRPSARGGTAGTAFGRRTRRSVLAGRWPDQLAPGRRPDDPMATPAVPPAYPEPQIAESRREYRGLVDDGLVNHHQQAARDLAETANARRPSPRTELHDWLSAVESMRLVLGTRLDVTEDMEPPDAGRPDSRRVRPLRVPRRCSSI